MRELIAQHKPRAPVNRCGYRLDDVLEHHQIHLARLMAGTEGTLGVITEATLGIQRIPAHRGVVLLLFDRLENAANAAIEISASGCHAPAT